MRKQLDQVMEFHKRFDLPTGEVHDESLDSRVINLRGRVIIEEAEEWMKAAIHEDPPTDRAKELADTLYTVLGAVIEEGFQDVFEKVFDAVHESNMSKLGADGQPIKREDGKVLKGPNYKPPDLNFIYDSLTII